jgi:hypothetical protein
MQRLLDRVSILANFEGQNPVRGKDCVKLSQQRILAMFGKKLESLELLVLLSLVPAIIFLTFFPRASAGSLPRHFDAIY